MPWKWYTEGGKISDLLQLVTEERGLEIVLPASLLSKLEITAPTAVQRWMGDFMKRRIAFIEFMTKDLLENAKIYVKNEEDYEKKHQRPYWENGNFANKNHGKTALKRKITYLRQELLNLERMIDNGWKL